MFLPLRPVWLLAFIMLAGVLSGCGDKDSVTALPAQDLDAKLATEIDPADFAMDMASLPSIEDPVAKLGRALFFSGSLSGDEDVACVSCHHPLLAGADGLSLSVGVQARQPLKLGPGRLIFPDLVLDPAAKDGPNVPRNAPTTFNIGFYDRFMFHDGRVHVLGDITHPNGAGLQHRTPDSFQNTPDLEAGANLSATQALFPVTSLFEMRGYGSFKILDNQQTRFAIEERLRQSPNWLEAFRTAFAQPAANAETLITYHNIAQALGEYQRSQVFVDNAWSHYLKGDREALDEAAKRGALLFFRSREEGGAGCAACHSGGHFTNEQFHVAGFPQIGRGKNTAQQDFGRFEVTQNETDRYAFRVPSLLNVARTAPYGHAGTFDTLEEVIRYHVDPVGGKDRFDYTLQSLSQYQGLTVTYPNVRNNTRLAVERFVTSPSYALLANPGMTDVEVGYLAAFLRSLTDSCVSDAACLAPWIAKPETDNPDGLMLQICFDEDVVAGFPCPPDPPRTATPPAPPTPPAETINPDVALKVAEADRLAACPNGLATVANAGQPVFTRLTSAETGIDHQHGYSLEYWVNNFPRVNELMVNGSVGVGDLNQDCWQDMVFTAGLEGNLTYLGASGFSFSKQASAGPAESNSSVTIADLNADYRPDLMVGNYPVYSLDGSVTETNFVVHENRWPDFVQHQNADTGISYGRNTSSIAVGDYNRDGWPDLMIGLWNLRSSTPADSHLWKNLGSMQFAGVDASLGLSGLSNAIDHSFSPSLVDFNNDGRTDVLMAGDFENSQVFVQQEAGNFLKVTDRSVISDENGMGSAVADFDNDGDLDWFVTSIYSLNPPIRAGNWGITGNRLYRNQDGTFADDTEVAGVRDGSWGWGACAADFDNDGDLDLFHVNGYALPDAVWERYKVRSQWTGDPPYFEFIGDKARLFINDGSGRFTRAEDTWGIADSGEGRGVSCYDADRDGDLDVVIVNNSAEPSVYRNESGAGAGRHFLSIRLVGNTPGTEALGARIYVESGGVTQMREVSLSTNYMSNNPLEQHFGLGGASSVDRVRVLWPRTGQISELTNVAANQFLVIAEPDA